MRANTLSAALVAVCMLAAPAAAGPSSEPVPVVETDGKTTPRPATTDELARYEQRERAADKQLQYEGGRRRSVDLVTIVLILLIIVLVLIIV